MKANDHLAILRLFAAEGAGADVVSEGELRRARAAGIPPRRIVFSGVGKSERDLRLALAEDIGQINVESAEELDMLSALAAGMGRTARIALRVNPDVDAAHPRQDLHRPRRRQVRHPLGRRRRALCPRRQPARHPADRPGDAYRQPDPVARAVPRRLCPHRRAGHRAARRRPHGRDGGLRRRPRHPLPRRAGAQPGRPRRRPARRVPQPRRPPEAGARPLAGRRRPACCWLDRRAAPSRPRAPASSCWTRR